MTTNYSDKQWISDLESILFEVSTKYASFDSTIIQTLKTAQESAKIGQREKSLGDLCKVYEDLTKKRLSYLSSQINIDKSKVYLYFYQFMELSLPVQPFDESYRNILMHGITTLKPPQRSRLKAICQAIHDHPDKFKKNFSSQNYKLDTVTTFSEALLNLPL